ncbi:MAG: family 10 glycosylhydrolase [Urechidicola sp.]|nr:family 10 glycosylhydrolase [Urechidicola sp.]
MAKFKELEYKSAKEEIIKLLDTFKSLNFNAVIFQIRPVADAFYNSKYEPWSEYLTGEKGVEPIPYYDPLAFIISETHKRGMEFHAWLNPYRAVVDYKESNSTGLNLIDENPEWFVNYGKNKYFDPGIPEVRTYTNKVVADIVQNYDIDAIHFDDYFYPYKIVGEEFHDENSFKKYGGNFHPNNLDDWRRNNVNLIIEELAITIKQIKPWVQFGISPFGVWRNKSTDPLGSDTEAGQTNYDDLYADILLWLKNDWLDYVLPQAYWYIDHEKANYKTIAKWWAENSYQTNVYLGQGVYKLNNEKINEAWTKTNPTEIGKQIDLNRSIPEIQGNVFFSAKTFLKNTLNINNELKGRYFQNPILPPISIKNNNQFPEPVFDVEIQKLKKRTYRLRWNSMPENKEKEAVKFLVYQFDTDEKIDFENKSKVISLTGENHIYINKEQLRNASLFVIIAVNRNNNTSKPVRIER